MCGRFTLTVTMEELLLYYLIDNADMPFHTPRYNVAPSQMIPTVTNDEGQYRIGPFKWGLIPFWAKDMKIGFKMINARSETVPEKPAFRGSFKQKRCLIPADGFYEWKQVDGSKQPMRIQLQNRKMFSMAGLYDTWTSPDGQTVHSCTIITTKPNALMADIHDRMPVILQREDESVWLDQGHDPELLRSLLQPYPAEEMKAYPVSKMVGNVKNDKPECIEEIAI